MKNKEQQTKNKEYGRSNKEERVQCKDYETENKVQRTKNIKRKPRMKNN